MGENLMSESTMSQVDAPPRVCEIPPQSGGWIGGMRGDRIQVVALDGEQVADLFAVSTGDPQEWVSTGWTRAIAGTLFHLPGQCFCGTRGSRLLTFMEDRTPAPHDMHVRSCDPLL